MASTGPAAHMEMDKDATCSTTPGTSKRSSPRESQPDPGSVGAAAGKRGIIVCPSAVTLTDAADLLIKEDHTAALVLDEAGSVLGVITENDLLTAFVEGVGWEAKVSRWLEAGDARLPQRKLQMHTVAMNTPLREAARLMRLQRTNDSGEAQACHHLLVKTSEGEIAWILSAMDIARALVALVPDESGALCPVSSGKCPKATLAHELVGDKRVADAMKIRTHLPECPLSVSLAQSFREMFAANQNCVAVVDDDGNPGEVKHVHGIITPRDLVRAFAEHVPGDTTTGGWLRGMQSNLEPRTVSPNAGLLEAADIMTTLNVHHLVVVEPGSPDIQGVLSSLDLACIVGEV